MFTLLYAAGGVLAIFAFLYISRTIAYVGNDEVGIVERLWAPKGSVKEGIIALNGEAGVQPDILRGGFHLVGFPFQHRIFFDRIVTIPPGQLAYVFALDGVPLAAGQVLGSNATASKFSDVRHFLNNGGNKGPQRLVLREGAHPLNTAQFVVITRDQIYATGIAKSEAVQSKIQALREELTNINGFSPVVLDSSADEIGVVTVLDGPALSAAELIAPDIGNSHHSFQDPEAFLAAGGLKGRQLQVLLEGTYYINRLFAHVVSAKKAVVPIGSVGVVISYTGKKGEDLSGSEYQHGELVGEDSKGVRRDPLLPGKYALNPFSLKLAEVPTTNFILKWEASTTGSQFDQNLKEVSLITSDAFEPDLPLSVVVHVDYRQASKVIQRFGDIKNLVEQTLDPMVSAYFKNVAQTKTLIELLQHRSELQQQAKEEMRTRFSEYNLELLEVLIGTPRPKQGDDQIEGILRQLRDRQVAMESIETRKAQQAAANAERALNETRAIAAQQERLTTSNINVQVNENDGKARVALAEKVARETEALANGEAARIKAIAEANAHQIEIEGEATAKAAKLQVDAMGGAEYRLQQEIAAMVTDAVAKSGVAVVPQIQVGSEGGAGLPGLIQALTANVLQAKVTGSVSNPGA